MKRVTTATADEEAGTAEATRRIVLTMGGKGGVGKTGFMLLLAEWYQASGIPITILDLDTENKAKGSMKHYFPSATKVNIHTPAGLDAFIDHLEAEPKIILADMGAGSGRVTSEWFDAMYEDVAGLGVRFTAVGIVTPDPASVESVLAWATQLQNRVDYLVVENETSQGASFEPWRNTRQAQQFRDAFHPAVMRMPFRIPDLENATRQYGVTFRGIANRQAEQPELKKTSLVVRAQSYLRRTSAEFEIVKELLLP